MKSQAERFGARFSSENMTHVDLSVRPFIIQTDATTLCTDALIVATGASTKWLGLSSEQALIGRGVCSCAICDGVAFKDEEVIVAGGGDTAIEDALFLANHASKVTVIHRRDRLRASPLLQKQALSHPKISFVWNSEIVDVMDPAKEIVTGVKIRNVHTQQTSEIACSGVFIAIGHVPNTQAFQDN